MPLSERKLAQMREMLSDLKLIIIDEFSMLSADMLYIIHLRLCEVFQCDPKRDWFANKSIILVGDLLQLPPVKACYVFAEPLNDNFATFHEVSPLWGTFEAYVLRHNHRQADEKDWANSLNNFRVGEVSKEDEAVLKSRITEEQYLDDDAMHVFYMNDDVNKHNDKMLDSIVGEAEEIDAIKANPKGFTPNVSKQTVHTTNFMNKLKVKIGARVSLVFNVNTPDNLVNGSFGTIVGFERTRSNAIEVIVVAFDDPNAGVQQRRKYPNISRKYENVRGTPIYRQECEYQTSNKGGARAKVVQFPIRLAWANTAHKMQVILK